MMGRMSRNKGKVGERELAQELSRVLGVTARRGVQYSGGPDSPDVVTDIPNLHIECKRTESFRLFEALEQAIHDAGADQTPVVMHRPNRRPWVVVLRLDDLPRLVECINQVKDSGNRDQDSDSLDS
ncbi:MAG: hypothetical protein FWH27_06380 [Planctomycetaceae bacterium]|nr:hypothetical protein [Planctomycetaceae bacterium]